MGLWVGSCRADSVMSVHGIDGRLVLVAELTAGYTIRRSVSVRGVSNPSPPTMTDSFQLTVSTSLVTRACGTRPDGQLDAAALTTTLPTSGRRFVESPPVNQTAPSGPAVIEYTSLT